MKNIFLFSMCALLLTVTSSMALSYSQEPLQQSDTSSENILSKGIEEKPINSNDPTVDETSSQETNSPLPPYQTTSFSCDASGVPTNAVPLQASNSLPATKYPIERKYIKGFATYCGLAVASVAAVKGSSYAAAYGLSPLLVTSIGIGSGLAAGIVFTYVAWKLLNYYFEN